MLRRRVEILAIASSHGGLRPSRHCRRILVCTQPRLCLATCSRIIFRSDRSGLWVSRLGDSETNCLDGSATSVVSGSISRVGNPGGRPDGRSPPCVAGRRPSQVGFGTQLASLALPVSECVPAISVLDQHYGRFALHVCAPPEPGDPFHERMRTTGEPECFTNLDRTLQFAVDCSQLCRPAPRRRDCQEVPLAV